MNFKHKNFNFALETVEKAKEEGKTKITGFASTFGGEPDHHGDVIAEGAFVDTIKEVEAGNRSILLLYGHDTDQVIGVVDHLEETKAGLYIEATISSTTLGKDVSILIKDGVLNKFSIGFFLKDYEYTNEGVLLIKDIDLFEVSVVPFPANDNAEILTAKERGMKEGVAIASGLSEGQLEAVIKSSVGAAVSAVVRELGIKDALATAEGAKEKEDDQSDDGIDQQEAEGVEHTEGEVDTDANEVTDDEGDSDNHVTDDDAADDTDEVDGAGAADGEGETNEVAGTIEEVNDVISKYLESIAKQ